MLSRVLSGAVLGINAYFVRVEVDVANGIPSYATVGLPQGAVKEGKERIVAAIRNSGFELPPRRITINLAPADVRKEGSAFDLPIAVGILAGTGQLSAERLGRVVVLGELGLDGSVRPIRGALPVVAAVRERGGKAVILPRGNLREATLVEGIRVLGVDTLREVADLIEGRVSSEITPAQLPPAPTIADDPAEDFADVRGQEHARRALEVAAAGAHNVLMIGPPGAGKTMLARRLPGVLPPLTFDEALETTKIHSVAGLLTPGSPLVGHPPFRAPHHTVSDAGLIGGGSTARPGEVSLAHNGILYLDELPEFRRGTLEALRQPLEDRRVTISRAGLTLSYPSSFLLVATLNPCPCGFYGDPVRSCTCGPGLVQRYLSRVSGPLRDRIDIHLEIPGLSEEALGSQGQGEGSVAIRSRVHEARARQRARFADRPGATANAHMRPRELRDFCRLDERGSVLLRAAISRLGFSGRGYHRVLKLARTIADMAGSDSIGVAHVAEAIQYRSLDRLEWR